MGSPSSIPPSIPLLTPLTLLSEDLVIVRFRPSCPFGENTATENLLFKHRGTEPVTVMHLVFPKHPRPVWAPFYSPFEWGTCLYRLFKVCGAINCFWGFLVDGRVCDLREIVEYNLSLLLFIFYTSSDLFIFICRLSVFNLDVLLLLRPLLPLLLLSLSAKLQLLHMLLRVILRLLCWACWPWCCIVLAGQRQVAGKGSACCVVLLSWVLHCEERTRSVWL